MSAGRGKPTSQIHEPDGRSTKSAAWSKSFPTRPRTRRERNPRSSRSVPNAETRAKQVPPVPEVSRSEQKTSGVRGLAAGDWTLAFRRTFEAVSNGTRSLKRTKSLSR